MQIIMDGSEEGSLSSLGWISGRVIRFRSEDLDSHLKIPHMGWDSISLKKRSLLFNGLEQGARFYFVHSYHVVCDEPTDILTTTTYGTELTSSLQKENIIAVQLQPEKSHRFGTLLLKNFVEHT